MKIGILQTGRAPDEILADKGDYDEMFHRLLAAQGFDFETYPVLDMVFPDTPQHCDGWLITGSKHGVYEDHAFIPPLEDFIRETFAAAIPMVGICFGHQIIAQALGGDVRKFDGGWAVGRQSYDMGGVTFHLNAWHQDQVLTPPEGAEVIASNDFCANAAMIYDNRAFTVQPHPEFDAEVIEGLTKYRGKGVVPDDQLAQAVEDLPKAIDDVKLAQMIGTFFRKRTLT